MSDKEQIDQILHDIRKMETLISGMKERLTCLSLSLEEQQQTANECKTGIQEVEEKKRIEAPNLSLNEVLEKKNLSDFRKAFSLNDHFFFRRELFAGDDARMNKAIADLNELHTYEDSVTYLNNELKWNIEDETVASFIKLLEKRFL